MGKRNIPALLMIVLFLAVSGWTIFYIFFHDESYKGEPLLAHKVVLSDDMKFASSEDFRYYFFTTEEYKAVFRLKNGGYSILKADSDLENRVRALKYRDTIDIMLRVADNRKIFKDKKIEVIGLSVNDTLLIDPAAVKEVDRKERKRSLFVKWMVIAVAGIILFVKYRQRKREAFTDIQPDESAGSTGQAGDSY